MWIFSCNQVHFYCLRIDTIEKEVADGSNDSLQYPNEELDPIFQKGSPLQKKTFEKVDVSQHYPSDPFWILTKGCQTLSLQAAGLDVVDRDLDETPLHCDVTPVPHVATHRRGRGRRPQPAQDPHHPHH